MTQTDDIILALQRNQLDIGLLVTPLLEPNLEEHPLFHEPFFVYATRGSELSTQSEVKERDLEPHDILLLTEGHCLREQMLKVCSRQKRAQAEDRLQFESGSIETLCHLVETGHGYTMVPYLAKQWLGNRSGVVVPFAAPQPSREVSLVVHRSFVRQSILRALSGSILSRLPPELLQPAKQLKTIEIR